MTQIVSCSLRGHGSCKEPRNASTEQHSRLSWYDLCGALQGVLEMASDICCQRSAKQHWTLLKTNDTDSDLYQKLLLTLVAVELHFNQVTSASDDAVVSFLSDNHITASEQVTVQHELLRPNRKKKRKSDKQKHKKRHKSKHSRQVLQDGASDDSLDDLDLGIMSDSDTPGAKPHSTSWQIKVSDSFKVLISDESLPYVLLYHALQTWLAALGQN